MANPTLSPAANGAGWNKTDVTVAWNWADTAGGSGIDPSGCTTSSTSSGEGTIQLTAICKDLAGNIGQASYTVKVDKTAPMLNPNITPNPVFLNGSTSANPSASDATSGLASSSCGALNTSTVGTKTVTCTAADKAGNSATATASYSVIYNFSGFFSPVSNPPTVNSVKASAKVSVIFSLADNQGLNIFPPNKPTSQQMDCSSKLLMGSPTATNPPGSSGLSYQVKKNQYTYSWQTDKTWAGTCRQFSLTLTDGTQHVAYYQFSK